MKIRRGASGIHLFERNTGLNVLLDEIPQPPHLWSIAPRNVSISITNTCDLACRYCFAPKTPARLDPEQLAAWMDELDRLGCMGVGFGGGEPTLHPQLHEICRHGAKRTRLAITLTTHAHRLTESIAESLAGNVNFIRVSMDGIAGTYERLRGRPFKTLQNQLKTVRALARFGINYVVNADTITELDLAINFASEAGASEFLLLPQMSVGHLSGIDSETIRSLRNWVREYRGGLPLRISENAVEGLPTCDPFPNDVGLHAFAHISASGVLMRTSFDHCGVVIDGNNLIGALEKLSNLGREDHDESLVRLRL